MCSNSKFQHRKIARQLVLYSSSILNPQCVPLRKLHYSHFSISRKWKWSCSVVSDSLPPVDSSPQSSSVHGILQARILEWVAVSFSRGSSQPKYQTQDSNTGIRPRGRTRVSRIAGRCFNPASLIKRLRHFNPESVQDSCLVRGNIHFDTISY